MLFNVTAFLSTPVIASVVAGVLGMPPAVSPITAATVSEALARPATVAVAPVAVVPFATEHSVGGGSGGAVGTDIPQPFIGPDPIGGGASLDALARLDGVALLDQLVQLTPDERTSFLDLHPQALDGLATTPPVPASVTDWWVRTSAVARAALTRDLPAVIGNLEGLPYAVRDRANREFLAQTVADIRARLDAGVGRAKEDELRSQLRMLSAVEEALRIGSSGERRSLVLLDVAGQGRAVIAVGDLSQADYVTYFVPGMYVGVSDQLVDWTGNAETSLLEQQEWLDRLGIDGEVATVAWIGYHTPTVVNISSLDLAYQGRDVLTGSLQGLASSRAVGAERSNPYVTIVAHSYGSTAAMLALQQNNVTVDALVLVGSPGSPATSVADLKVANGNVWVAATDSDPVPRSGVYGSQPLDAGFGAHRFSVAATTDPITGETLDDISGHVYYFWPGTTSVRNTALIALGQGTLATTDGPQDGSGTLLARSDAH